MLLKSINIIGTISILTLANPLFAQDTFERVFGYQMDDVGNFVQQIPDGGYIIVGITTTENTESGFLESDIYLIKTDILGDTVWTKAYGTQNYNETGLCIQYTSDMQYIISGSKMHHLVVEATPDLMLIKSNGDGEQEWVKTFDDSFQSGNSIKQTSDGGYVVAGSFGSLYICDFSLKKIDSSGTEQWTKTYPGMQRSHCMCVQQTSDEGYVIIGQSGPTFGSPDIYLIKTDSNGDVLWTNTYGGDDNDAAYCVHQTSDEGYIIAGYTKSFGAGNSDVYLIKTNSSGETLWTRTFGGTGADAAHCLRQTSDEGYILAGYTNSFGVGDFDAYLIKTNSSGETQWTQTFGSAGDDRAYCVQQTSDGGYIFTGSTDSYGSGGKDVYLVKTNESGIMTEIDEPALDENPVALKITQNFPNPFKTKTIITYQLPVRCEVELNVYNMVGQKVATLSSGLHLVGRYKAEWDAAGLTSGVYLCRLESDKGKVDTIKLIVSK